MNEETLNCIRSALLFTAEKYRLIIALADRFDDGPITDLATQTERNARRIANTIGSDGIVSRDDAMQVETSLAAFTDALNRQMQKLNNQGMVTESRMVEDQIVKVYAASQAVSVVARGLTAEAA